MSYIKAENINERSTWQEMTPAGAAGLAPLVARLAYGEGLAAHARAAEARLGDITTGTDE